MPRKTGGDCEGMKDRREAALQGSIIGSKCAFLLCSVQEGGPALPWFVISASGHDPDNGLEEANWRCCPEAGSHKVPCLAAKIGHAGI